MAIPTKTSDNNLMSDQLTKPIPTDEEVLVGLNRRFKMLAEMTHGVARGAFHGLIIQGEKGLGKSHTVHAILDEYDPTVEGNEEMPEEQRRSIKRFTGKITPMQLYLALQEYSGKKCILLFDDCDSAWNDIGALNILKAAMDTKPRRTVTWASSARAIREQSFVFEGSVIVITNAHMHSGHYKAFLDRVHKFRVTMTAREKLLKIQEIATVAPEYDRNLASQVFEHIQENLQYIGPRLSMRTFVKTYELVTFSENWRELAMETVYAEEQ